MPHISVKIFRILTSGLGYTTLNYFLFITLVAILFSRAKPLDNVARGHFEEHFCECIITLDQQFSRRNRFNIFLLYISGGHFVQWNGAIWAIL